MINATSSPQTVQTASHAAPTETATCNLQKYQGRAKSIVTACMHDLAFELLNPAGKASTVLSSTSLAASLGMLLATMDNHDKERILGLAPGELTPQLAMAIDEELGRFSRKHPFGFGSNQMVSTLNFMASKYNPCHDEDFVNVLTEHYKAKLLTSYGNKNIADVTDEYVNYATGGEIPELLANHPLRDSIDTTINNVLLFRGQWANKFDENNTKFRPFMCADGTTIDVKMMSLTDRIGFFVDPNRMFSAIAKPFKQGEKELYLLAIATLQPSPDDIGRINKEDIDHLINTAISSTPRKVELTFPVMKINSTNGELLDQIGSFRGIEITPDKLKKLGGPTPDTLSTRQTIIAEINEEGASGSVATTTAISTRTVGFDSDHFKFDFDSPGLVFIVDDEGNRVLEAVVKNGDYLVTSGESGITDGASSNKVTHTQKKRKKVRIPRGNCVMCGGEHKSLCLNKYEALKPKMFKMIKDWVAKENENPVKEIPSSSTQSFVTAQNLVVNFPEAPQQPSKNNNDSPETAFLPPKNEQLQSFGNLTKGVKESQLLMALQEKFNDIPIKKVKWGICDLEIVVDSLEEAKKITRELTEFIGEEHKYCGGASDFSNSPFDPRISAEVTLETRDILVKKLFLACPKTLE